jgi:transcriptional regulator with XRE-family HTH domain
MKDAIRLVRLKRGLSQRALAQMLGVQRPTVSRYESGTRELSVEGLREMADALQVDPGLFYRLTEDAPELLTLLPLEEVEHVA